MQEFGALKGRWADVLQGRVPVERSPKHSCTSQRSCFRISRPRRLSATLGTHYRRPSPPGTQWPCGCAQQPLASRRDSTPDGRRAETAVLMEQRIARKRPLFARPVFLAAGFDINNHRRRDPKSRFVPQSDGRLNRACSNLPKVPRRSGKLGLTFDMSSAIQKKARTDTADGLQTHSAVAGNGASDTYPQAFSVNSVSDRYPCSKPKWSHGASSKFCLVPRYISVATIDA